jgi:nicotinate-nucleotide pyrophosphorylase (carboxylating)
MYPSAGPKNVFNTLETAACRRLVALALEEDLGSTGDLTSQATIPADLIGRAVVVVRQPGCLAGIQSAEMAFAAVDPTVTFEEAKPDASLLQRGDKLAVIEGPMRSILAGERTALNFLQHLSGIATLTRRYVEAIEGTPCRILDTRKTTPGWRLLAKYAVRCGGGDNHRMGLCDGVLIKDNHLAALAKHPDAITESVRLARQKYGTNVPLEIEIDTLEQLEVALRARPDIVLLDNMSLDNLRLAVQRRNEVDPRVLLEASGGVTLDTVRAIAETGVDRISVGALTHSAPALDIALDYLP